MSDPAPIVFLFDVDDTLLDNDRVHDDFDRHIAEEFGADEARRYWAIYEQLRAKLGYADYLGAVQQFRLGCDDELKVQKLAAFLLNYPFAERLYPGALDAIAHLSQFGPCAVLSDGDVVLQPRKIEVSGIAAAVQGRVLIYIHKEHMLDDVIGHYPAHHYVMVEDKLRVLDGMKRQWRERLTTVFVRQGHYAAAGEHERIEPPPDHTIACIGELRGRKLEDFLPSAPVIALAAD